MVRVERQSGTDVSGGIRLDLVGESGESGTDEFGEGIKGRGDDEGIGGIERGGLEWMF